MNYELRILAFRGPSLGGESAYPAGHNSFIRNSQWEGGGWAQSKLNNELSQLCLISTGSIDARR